MKQEEIQSFYHPLIHFMVQILSDLPICRRIFGEIEDLYVCRSLDQISRLATGNVSKKIPHRLVVKLTNERPSISFTIQIEIYNT